MRESWKDRGKSLEGWSFVKTISLLLLALNWTFHFLAQVDIFARSLLRIEDVCSTLDAEAMSVVSSAKIIGSDSRSEMISLMNNMKRIGPSRDPCGTPASTGNSDECCPSTTVLAVLPLR